MSAYSLIKILKQKWKFKKKMCLTMLNFLYLTSYVDDNNPCSSQYDLHVSFREKNLQKVFKVSQIFG